MEDGLKKGGRRKAKGGGEGGREEGEGEGGERGGGGEEEKVEMGKREETRLFLTLCKVHLFTCDIM